MLPRNEQSKDDSCESPGAKIRPAPRRYNHAIFMHASTYIRDSSTYNQYKLL
jgi:hypothetical protein